MTVATRFRKLTKEQLRKMEQRRYYYADDYRDDMGDIRYCFYSKRGFGVDMSMFYENERRWLTWDKIEEIIQGPTWAEEAAAQADSAAPPAAAAAGASKPAPPSAPYQTIGNRLALLERIVPGRYQPRRTFDQANLEELAADIQRRGIINALKVFVNEDGKYELIAGERRYRAARMAGMVNVPVEIVEASLEQIRELSIVDNLQREDLTPLEEAEAYLAMLNDLGIAEAELARRVAKSRGYVQQRLAIARAAPAVKQSLGNGSITLVIARALAQGAPGAHTPQEQALKLVLDNLKKGMHVTEQMAKEYVRTKVTKSTTKAIEALGWRVNGSIVWGGSERPKQWTPAELLEAVNAGRRPAGEELPDEEVAIAEEHQRTLEQRYQLVDVRQYRPWISLWYGDEQPRWIAPTEVSEVVQEIDRDFADYQQRYARYGWTLTVNEYGRMSAQHELGNESSFYSWRNIREFLNDIQAGKVPHEKPKPKPVQEYYETCQSCGQKVKVMEQSMYRLHLPKFQAKKVCKACYDAAIAQRDQELEVIRRRIIEEHGMLLVRMGSDLLVRLLMHMRHSAAIALGEKGHVPREELWKHLGELSVDTLCDAVTAQLAMEEWERGEM